MNRWISFLLCLLFGGALFAVGWHVPVHMRAVDGSVIRRAGQDTTGLVERGLALVAEHKTGVAQLLSLAAEQEKLAGHEKLRASVDESVAAKPEWRYLGAAPRSKTLLAFTPKPAAKSATNSTVQQFPFFTQLVVQIENRQKALDLLRNSRSPAVQQLLRCRTLTNTVLFPPSQSSAGQAFDTAIAICGLLLEEQQLTSGLNNAISASASEALKGGSTQPLEQILLDVLSLGQRFNWAQLAAFCTKIEEPETLRLQANLVRKAESQLPILFSAVDLSGQPAAVAKYWMDFSKTAQKDLAASLHFGAGAVNELLKRNQRLHHAGFQGKMNSFTRPLVYLSWQIPELALALKWLSYLGAGFFTALAMHFARGLPPKSERPFHVHGFHFAREILFALGFLLVVLLLSEPFLAEESQKMEFPLRLQLPTVGSAIAAENTGARGSIMNQFSLLALLLFFVLQALIYVACLLKLAEIRRQTFPANIKLKLLENEEHLFDAGLYLGFAGTIISLIMVSMGVIKPSLMAAYSSTSFGVVFVSIFKIFNLRPFRRKLLLDVEAMTISTPAPSERPLAAPL